MYFYSKTFTYICKTKLKDMKFETKKQALKHRNAEHAKGNLTVKVFKFASNRRKKPFFVGNGSQWLIAIS